MTIDSPRTSIWLAGKKSPPAKRKADEGALDRDRIVAATVRLLDAEGLARFSMRRLAAELGVTAMSVYWYVDNKDGLLELALDEVSGEMTLPGADDAADWREQLRQVAGEYRKMLVAHPWLPELMVKYLNIGPHTMAFSDTVLNVMRRSGVPLPMISGATSAVFQFVYGFATTQGVYQEKLQAANMSEAAYFTEIADLVESRLENAEAYRETIEATRARGDESISEMWERNFEIALDMVIAGIEAVRDR